MQKFVYLGRFADSRKVLDLPEFSSRRRRRRGTPFTEAQVIQAAEAVIALDIRSMPFHFQSDVVDFYNDRINWQGEGNAENSLRNPLRLPEGNLRHEGLFIQSFTDEDVERAAKAILAKGFRSKPFTYQAEILAFYNNHILWPGGAQNIWGVKELDGSAQPKFAVDMAAA